MFWPARLAKHYYLQFELQDKYYVIKGLVVCWMIDRTGHRPCSGVHRFYFWGGVMPLKKEKKELNFFDVEGGITINTPYTPLMQCPIVQTHFFLSLKTYYQALND